MSIDRRDERPPEAETKEASRRSFLGRLWLGLGGLALAQYAWLVFEFLRPRRAPTEAPGVLVAGPVDRFDPGTVTAFPAGKLYVSRLSDGGFLAVSRECTHLGCTVPWIEEEGRFVCPCHSSEYDIRGDVLSPPAPRALDLHPVRIENGIVKVDTGRTLKRAGFEASQAVRG